MTQPKPTNIERAPGAQEPAMQEPSPIDSAVTPPEAAALPPPAEPAPVDAPAAPAAPTVPIVRNDGVTVQVSPRTAEKFYESRKTSLVQKIAERFGVEPEKMLATLRATAFKTPAGKPDVTNEQMMMLLVVANELGLNPFSRGEIFAFPDDKAGIVPIVGVDGWTKIIVSHPQYDGYEIKWAEETVKHADKLVPLWCECTMYRKDISRPITHREYFDEVRRNTGPWGSHPRRMMEHKTIIQTARRVFGFSGVYDLDEGERIIEAQAAPASGGEPMPAALAAINDRAALK